MSRRLLVIGCALILAGGLAACGKVGELEPASPLFGGKAKPGEAAPKQDPTRPVQTVDPRDRSTDNLPSRTEPIPGTNPGASGLPPRTSFPDPYANPK